MPKPPRNASTVTVRTSPVYVDWTTASVRTVVIVVLLVLTVFGGIGYYFYRENYGPDAPASRARRELFKAQDQMMRAREYGRSQTFSEALRRGEKALAEATEAFAAERWGLAETRALDSQKATNEILGYVRSTRKQGPTAKFVRIVGNVQVKKKDDSRWVDAHGQMELDPGDLVRSRDEGSAQILFFDGVSLMLSPASLIEIQLRGKTRDGLNRNPNVHLSVGQVDLSTPKFNTARTTPSLSTDNVEARLKNDTELRVHRNEASKQTDLVVSGRGGAEIRSGGGETTELAPNEAAAVEGAGEQVSTVKRTLPRAPLLILPTDLKVFYEKPAEGVTLRWQQLSEASAYHVQISDSSLWARALVDRRDIAGEASVTIKGLDFGEYYWRVASIDADGYASPFSQYRKFVIRDPAEVQASTSTRPPRLDLTKKMVFENIFILKGATDPGAVVTVNDERADVEEDGSFTHFTTLYNDGLNNVEVVARDGVDNATRQTIRVRVSVF